MAAMMSSDMSTSINGSRKMPDDPFNEATPKLEHRKSAHRFSAFDNQLFASYQPAASPASAKKALEAHISETDKRLEEASKLGTALVQQRQDLAEKLKEIEQHLEGQEMTPELRRQLAEVEKEYNELGRESARAFLAHKPRIVSGEGETPGRSASPTKFSSQATDSPSKISVPSRKQRNQVTSRVGDIEFVTQISTSLLSQVRQLQAVLAERDDSLKALTMEKSRIEMDNEGLVTRMKSLDESEQKFKDENWTLETQTHELMAAAKESGAKEQKLQQSLALMTSQKSAAQRELDDVKQAHGKISDDLIAFKKTHDSEASGLRKNVQGYEAERDSLQKRIDELTSQNQELAKGMVGRFRQGDEVAIPALGVEPDEMFLDNTNMDHSPPPSPIKGAARNSVLESETLKSSLHHAHRMIQNLKSNIHREKTEKLDLKRMLQESRDELEQRRSDPNGSSKRHKTKSIQDIAKKDSRMGQLGAGRQSQTSVEMDDPDWVDRGDGMPRQFLARTSVSDDTTTEAYQTATDNDDAFTTADERATETEEFQTGNEGPAGESSEELTETEAPGAGAGAFPSQARKSSQLYQRHTKRNSFVSTASTSDDEPRPEVRTPVQGSFKHRSMSGKADRRSRMVSEEPSSSPLASRDSPASFTGASNGQSLFAELEDLDNGSDEETASTPGNAISTPSRGLNSSFISTPSRLSSQSVIRDPPKSAMVDSSMMTDVWQPESQPRPGLLTAFVAAVLPASMTPGTPVKTVDADSQPTKNIMPSHQDRAVQPTTPIIRNTDTATQFSRDNTPLPQDKSIANGLAPVIPSTPTPKQAVKPLTFSTISSTHIKPAVAPALPMAKVVTEAERPITAIQTGTPTNEVKDAAAGGVIGSMLGWAIGKKQGASGEAVDGTPTKPLSRLPTPQAKQPFMEISPNIRKGSPSPAPKTPLPIPMTDSGVQTILSSVHVNSLLLTRVEDTKTSPIIPTAATPPALAITESSPAKSNVLTPTSPGSSSGVTYSFTPREMPYPPRSPKRPSSAHSYRSTIQDAPPLPVDHRKAIAAAQVGPSREKTELRSEGSMAPPTMTAAAYRANMKKTQRDGNLQASGALASSTPKARYSTTRSMRSRRSSMSSFESELDARFNIRTDGMPMGNFDGGTDPRMIQAITQTMIGEFLWKYTRKAGRGEMSHKRHRRFFWVHPYTRTLYWSDQDPSTAGRAQLKAKSVAIEAVRVVADDNPMPPGLHRKSLVIITPGRDIKFTATTGQRHETWFNALSYLLLRSTEGQMPDPHALTAEDVAEFNPGFGRAGGSRVSLSSYNSRTNTTRRSLASIRATSPEKSIASRRTLTVPQPSNSIRNNNNNNNANTHTSVSSRISNLWRPSRSSTVSDAQDTTAADQIAGSIYNASVVNDSAEDVRQVLEKQDQDADRLENVRACCDGKSFSLLYPPESV